MEIAIQTMTDVPTSLDLARWAESEGLAGFAVADHYLTGSSTYALDQLTVLAAVAAGTERIPLSSLVSPITFRHPAVMLKTAVTLDQISGGRFTLGLGAGWLEEEHEAFGFEFPPVGERFDRLTEALGYLSAALSGDESGYHGDHYRLAPGSPPEPRGDVRLMVGGSGPRRTPELAGRYAAEFNVFPSRHPMAPRVEAAREAAADAGRDPGSLLISTAFPLVVGEDASDLRRRIEQMSADREVDVERVTQRWPAVGIPVAVAGEYRERLSELEQIGVARVYLQVAFDTLDDIQRMVGLLNS